MHLLKHCVKLQYFDENLPLQNFIGYESIRGDLSVQMKTVAENHLDQHLWHFLYKWAKRRVWLFNKDSANNLPKDYANKIVGYITKSEYINLDLIDDVFRRRIEFYHGLIPQKTIPSTIIPKDQKWRQQLIVMYNLLLDLEQDLCLDISKGIFR